MLIFCTNAFAYSDIQENHWAWEYVEKLTDMKIIGGYPDGSFKPNKAVIRQELAKMVALFLDRMDVAHTDRSIIDRFADGSMFKKWASQYIERLRKAGVIGGDDLRVAVEGESTFEMLPCDVRILARQHTEIGFALLLR